MDVEPVALWAQRLSSLEELAADWKTRGMSVFQRSTGESDALRIAANSELVAAGRRDVSQRTREFAKLEPEAKMNELGSLVKAYQSYVDEITRSLKHAETAYKNLSAFVKDLQDPYPALERFLRHKSSFLVVVKQAEQALSCKAQLNDREAELMELRNQDVTVRQLREQIATLEMSMASRCEAASSEASEEVAQLLRQWNERESAVQRELSIMSQECRRLQMANTDLSAEVETLRNSVANRDMQLDAAAEDAAREIEHLQVQLALAIRDRDAAVEQLLHHTPRKSTESASKSSSTGESTPNGMMLNVQQLHEATSTRDNEKLLALQRENEELHTRLIELNKVEAASSKKVQELSRKIAEQTQLAEAAAKEAAETRKLSAVLDADLFGCKSENNALRQRLEEAEKQNAELRTLVLDIQGESRDAARSAEPQSCNTKPFTLDSVIVPMSPSCSVADTSSRSATNVTAVPTSEEETVAALLLQRENLRKRIMTLEELATAEVRSLRTQLDDARREVRELSIVLHRDTEPDIIVEASRHPPSLLGLARQSAVDRAALIVSHFVLSSRESRRKFAAYQLLLHTALVMVLLFYVL